MERHKLLAGLISIVLAIGALTGCSHQTTDGEKDIEPVVSEYPSYEAQTYEPGIIEPVYPAGGVIMADYVIDSASGADPTGESDSTDAIRSVLDICSDNGGGTVFLPRGRYVVSSQIRIPSFVYLVGDWNDPDKEGFNGEYGTIIEARVQPAETEQRSDILADREDIYANFPSMFQVGGSAGLIGVTIWYPEQDIDSVTPYPFAVEIPSFAGAGGHINHHASTIKNVTFLNCYKGIIAGASASVFSGNYGAAFEQCHIENIRGTFLYQGFQMYIASDVGVVKNVKISNDYWKSCTLGAVDDDKIDEYTMKYTTGMLLGDLEWLFFNEISIRDVCMGVRIFDGIRRFFTNTIYFIGQFYHLDVRNTRTALRVDNMMPNFGITVAESYLEGSVYSINERDTTTSVVKLVNTTLVGDTYGDSIVQSGAEDKYIERKEAGELPLSIMPTIPEPLHTVYDVTNESYGADKTGASDASAAIQKALDDAHVGGGGIVYLPAGYYLLEAPLTVYADTELRGAAAAATRDQIGMSKGTVLCSNYGYSPDRSIALNKDALITLMGDRSGMRGIRIIYHENCPDPRAEVKYRLHSYVVRIIGKDAYLAQDSIVGVPFGVEIIDTSGVTVTEVSMACYETGFHIVNSENVHLDEINQNAAVVARLGFAAVPALQNYFLYGWPTDSSGLGMMYGVITRPLLTLFKAENSTDLTITNTCAFGIRTFYDGKDTTARILACDSDNCSDYIWKVDGGTLHSVNMFKYNDTDTYITENGGAVTCFNTLSLHFVSEYELDTDDVDGNKYRSVSVSSASKDVDDLPDRYIAK